MSANSDRYERIGLLADRVSNLLGAMKLPMPPQMHLDQLRKSLPELRDELRQLYADATGENPWEDQEWTA